MTRFSEQCTPEAAETCPYSTKAAKQAVREVFAIIGVNVDVPKEVEEFREDLRFGKSMRKIANKGIVTAVVVIVTFIIAALGVGFKQKILGP